MRRSVRGVVEELLVRELLAARISGLGLQRGGNAHRFVHRRDIHFIPLSQCVLNSRYRVPVWQVHPSTLPPPPRSCRRAETMRRLAQFLVKLRRRKSALPWIFGGPLVSWPRQARALQKSESLAESITGARDLLPPFPHFPPHLPGRSTIQLFFYRLFRRTRLGRVHGRVRDHFFGI